MVARITLLCQLLACFTLSLTAQVTPFTIGPNDPVNAVEVMPFQVDTFFVVTEAVPPGCPPAGGSQLPLLATEFRAERLDEKSVELTWEVAQTSDPFAWTLERQFGASGTFRTVRGINESVLLGRKAIDENSYSGRTYYRLHGLSPEGLSRYTRVDYVDNHVDAGAFQIYPNPVKGEAAVSIPSTQSAFELVLQDALGRTVWTRKYSADATGPLRVAFPSLPSGAYTLSWISAAGTVATRRVVF